MAALHPGLGLKLGIALIFGGAGEGFPPLPAQQGSSGIIRLADLTVIEEKPPAPPAKPAHPGGEGGVRAEGSTDSGSTQPGRVAAERPARPPPRVDRPRQDVKCFDDILGASLDPLDDEAVERIRRQDCK